MVEAAEAELLARTAAALAAARAAARLIAIVGAAIGCAGAMGCGAGGGAAGSVQAGGGAGAQAGRAVVAIVAAVVAFAAWGWRVAGEAAQVAAGGATGLGAIEGGGGEMELARAHLAALAALAAAVASAGAGDRAPTMLSSASLGALIGGVVSPVAMRVAWSHGGALAPGASGGGGLAATGALDVGGAACTHLAAGSAVLAMALVRGSRRDMRGRRRFARPAASKEEAPRGTGDEDAPASGFEGSNDGLGGVSALVLLVGLLLSGALAVPWALVAGGTMGSADVVGAATAALVMAPATGALVACAAVSVVSWHRGRGFGVLAPYTAVRGALAGAAAATAVAGTVDLHVAALIGACAGLGFVAATLALANVRIDDALNTIAVHGVGALVGLIFGVTVTDNGLLGAVYGAGAANATSAVGWRALGGLALALVVLVTAMGVVGGYFWAVDWLASAPPSSGGMDTAPGQGAAASAAGNEELESATERVGIMEREDIVALLMNLHSLAREGSARGGAARDTGDGIEDNPANLLTSVKPVFKYVSTGMTSGELAGARLRLAWASLAARGARARLRLRRAVAAGRCDAKRAAMGLSSAATGGSLTAPPGSCDEMISFTHPRRSTDTPVNGPWTIDWRVHARCAKGEDRVLVLPSGRRAAKSGVGGTYLEWRSTLSDEELEASALKGARLFCVFDGHGGAEGAEMARQRLPVALLDALAPIVGASPTTDGALVAALPAALTSAMERLDAEIKAACVKAGATATVVVIVGDVVTVANAGDSRCVLITPEVHEGAGPGSGGKCGSAVSGLFKGIVPAHVRLSVDHRPEDSQSEVRRVRAAGAVVGRIQERSTGMLVGPLRVYPGGLAVSRSLGDARAHACVMGTPHVCQVDLGRLPPAVGWAQLVVASDGLWDVAKDSEVAAAVRRVKAKGAAAHLAYLASVRRANRGCPDDITIASMNWSRETPAGCDFRTAADAGGTAMLETLVRVLSDAPEAAIGDEGDKERGAVDIPGVE